MLADRLPPSARDFEIHRLSLIELLSTRRVAEMFSISQTRVRQITGEVSAWLTEVLPIPDEVHQEKEKRYAIHLAAARLQHQIEQLQAMWNGSYDPKYLRQQNRSILALARLGVSHTTLDSLADNATTDHPPSAADESSPPPSSPSVPPPPSVVPPASSFVLSPSSFSSSPPPSEDCSPTSPQLEASNLEPEADSPPTSSPAETSECKWYETPDHLAGLKIIEGRLLTLIEHTLPEDHERRQDLQHSLTKIRRERSATELILSSKFPGAQLAAAD